MKEGTDSLFDILNSQAFPYLRPLTIFTYFNSCYKREGKGLVKKRARCAEGNMDLEQKKCRLDTTRTIFQEYG